MLIQQNIKEDNLITKAEYDALFSSDTKQGDVKNLIGKVENRIHFVISNICKDFEWWDWIRGGDFFSSVEEGDDFISLDGDYGLPEHLSNVCNWFDVEWLFKPCLDEIRQNEEKFQLKKILAKEKAKKKRAELKTKKMQMQEVIKAKLTKEELKFIKFK